jgi:hypothetical protein
MGTQQTKIDLSTLSTEDLLKQLQSREIKGGKLTFETDYEGITKEIGKIGSQFKSALDPRQLFDSVDQFAFKFDDLASQLSKQFGISKDSVGDIQRTIALSYRDVIDMGGDIDDILTVQQGITDSLHTNLIASVDNVNDLFATYQVTNVAPDKLISGFRDVGVSMSQIKGEMEKVVDYSQSVGANVNIVSSKVMENLGKLNAFNFQNGVEGLAKMAAQSAILGVDMKNTFALAEDLLDPQKAIDFSSSLQRLGVSSSQLLDPLRTMDLAQNDPAELQNQMVELSKQFVRTKEDGTFEIMHGAERKIRELASLTHMSTEEFASLGKKAFEVDEKLSKITFPEGLDATEDQKKLIANLSQFNQTTGKYEISLGLDESGKEIKKSIDQLPSNNKELTEMLDEATKPVKMEDLAKDQLSELRQIRKEGLKLTYQGKIESAAGISKEYTKAVEQNLTKPYENFKDFKSEDTYRTAYQGAGDARDKIRQGKDVSISDILEMAEGVGKNYVNTMAPAILNAYTEIKKVINDLDFKKIPGFDKMTDILDKIEKGQITKESLKTTLNEFMSQANDFYIDKNGIHKFNENDLLIGGINKKSGEVISNDPKDLLSMGNEKKTNNNDVLSEKNIKVNMGNLDFTPLTSILSKITDTNTTKIPLSPTINTDNLKNDNKNNDELLKILTAVKPNKNIDKLQRMDQDVTDNGADVQKFLNEVKSNSVKQYNEISKTLDISRLKENEEPTMINPLKEMADRDRGFGNLYDTNKEVKNQNLLPSTEKIVRETITPTPNQPSFSKLETPTSLPTQKVEFGKLEISLKVDIPNNANVNSDQIKQVLETTMNSTDFKQQLVVAINQAKTNFGQTSQGGTANYGPNKIKYS